MSFSPARSLARPGCRPEAARSYSARAWRDVLLPREHGSWSLAFEPVALGLIAAPSTGGAWLALAVAAGFFARRPLRLAVREHDPARLRVARDALAACAFVAVAAATVATVIAGTSWLIWLAPTALGGAVFLGFDLRNEGRDARAEVVGAAAFGFLPAAFAILAGAPARVALPLAFVMLARVVPTVLTVRACLRAAKSGRWEAGLPVSATIAMLTISVALYVAGLAPALWAGLLGLLALRTALLLVVSRPNLRARTLGIIEAVTGVVYVVVAGVAAP